MDRQCDAQLASFTTELGQTIYSLLTGTPAIHASSLAAYSRSAKSLPELLRYRGEKGIDAGEVLKRIISTYNHDSVRGLGHLSVAMEGIDCITAMQFFYNHHIQDGQERSTRYQDFTKHGRKYAPCPTPHNVGGYYEVLDYWLDGVEYFTPKVRQYLQDRFYVVRDNPALTPRTLDCVRYLIPMGISTNVGAIQSGREWSKWISTLHNLGQDSLAKGMELLLRDGWDGYTPEGEVLIRHTEGWHTPIGDLKDEVVRRGDYELWEPSVSITDTYAVVKPGHNDYFYGVDPLLIHLYLLGDPRMRKCHLVGNATHMNGIQKLLTKYSWQREVGPIGSSGAIAIHGMADIGTIKDLQRHRSCSSFIPLLHPEGSVYGELKGTPWSIHPYLVGTPLGDEMLEYLRQGYTLVRDWYYRDGPSTSRDRACKNLLPHAHVTPYIFYGSPATLMTYVVNLRARPGGHMAYRLLVHAWAESIAKEWPLWAGCIPPRPVVGSHKEFIDRT